MYNTSNEQEIIINVSALQVVLINRSSFLAKGESGYVVDILEFTCQSTLYANKSLGNVFEYLDNVIKVSLNAKPCQNNVLLFFVLPNKIHYVRWNASNLCNLL